MKIGIIGVGNMGGSIVSGLITSDEFLNTNLFLYNRTLEKISKFEKYNVNICENVEELIKSSEVIILAIKPNQYKEWLEEYKELIQNKLLITVAAGISQEFLKKYTSLFSITMPNMGSRLLQGYTVICKNKLLNEALANVLIEETSKIFKNIGKVKVIEESELNTYISLIGSSPAYFINIIDQMSKVFVKEGYDKKEIEQILAYIMKMSADLIINEKDKPTKEIVDSICSPNGTTIEAVNVLNDSNIENIFEKAINNCIIRANEMTDNNDKSVK